MLKREIKVNFKSFLIWTLILITIFFVVFLIYPSIINSENIEMMDEMMNMFPEEMLKAFNMDISSIDSAFGWLKSEGFVLVLLVIGSYAGIIGSNILLKEESDKTIEYLNSLPVTRKKIAISKVLCGAFYVLLMVLLVGIFNFLGLSITESFDIKQFILLSITPVFPAFVIFFLTLFISTFTHKTKKMVGLSLGIVFLSYILQIISTISDKVEFLKYLSVFTLADTRNVIQEISINPIMIIISFGLSIILLIATIIHYDRKELV